MKIFSLFLLASLVSITVRAQFTVSGIVCDAQTGQPLVGANVVLVNTTQGTVADTTGHYALSIKTDTARLQVSYIGYRTQQFTVNPSASPLNRDVSLMPTQNLAEVVIRAIRADEQAPVTQTTIDQQTLEQTYVGQDAIFVLKDVTPSMLTFSESGTNLTNYGQMRLRGIDQTRINITLDGIPLNDMIDQGVFFSNFTDFGNSVASVQVQRGVGTSTNGTASFAGSINFESVNLRDSVPSTEIQLLGGSFDTYRASGEVKTGLLSNRTAFYSRFTRTLSEGYRYHTGTDSYSFFFSGGYFGDKDVLKVTAFTGRTKNDLAYLAVALPDIQQDPKTNYVSDNDTDDFGQQLVQLQYTRLLTNNTSLVTSLYYGGAGGDFPFGFEIPDSTYQVSRQDTSYAITNRFTQINYPLYNRHYGFMSYVNHIDDRGNLDVSGGVHAYTFRRENIESVVPDKTPYYQDHSQKDELSGFGKVSYQWNQWLLFADAQLRAVRLRLTPDEAFLGQPAEVPDRSYTFFNPKVGVTYLYNHRLNFYASYGRSGREPTRFDILGAAQINRFNLASVQNVQSVKPEYVNDLEAGMRLNTSRLSGEANLFYMRFKNEIAPIGQSIPEGFIQLRKNVPKSYRRGIEVVGEYAISPALSLSGTGTYMQSSIAKYAPEDDERVYQDVQPLVSPRWIINSALTYQYAERLEVAFSARYVSQSYLEPTNQPNLVIPEYSLMDARASVHFLKKHTVSLHVNNLLNQSYFTFGQPVVYEGDIVPGYFAQAPRNFYALLQLRF